MAIQKLTCKTSLILLARICQISNVVHSQVSSLKALDYILIICHSHILFSNISAVFVIGNFNYSSFIITSWLITKLLLIQLYADLSLIFTLLLSMAQFWESFKIDTIILHLTVPPFKNNTMKLCVQLVFLVSTRHLCLLFNYLWCMPIWKKRFMAALNIL